MEQASYIICKYVRDIVRVPQYLYFFLFALIITQAETLLTPKETVHYYKIFAFQPTIKKDLDAEMASLR